MRTEWYNLAFLAADIRILLDYHHGLDLQPPTFEVANLFPEPLPTADFVAEMFPQLAHKCVQKKGPAGPPYSFLDDVKTRHWARFKDAPKGYRYSREQTLLLMKQFVAEFTAKR